MIEKLLILNEGFKTMPYRCTAGKLTIGVGRNLDDRGITPEEARYLLRNDLARVRAELDSYLPWWSGLSEVRRAVLIDMAFNLGIHGLLKFRNTLEALRRGDWQAAAAEMKNSKWYRDVGRRGDRLIQMVLTDAWPKELDGR